MATVIAKHSSFPCSAQLIFLGVKVSEISSANTRDKSPTKHQRAMERILIAVLTGILKFTAHFMKRSNYSHLQHLQHR